MPANPCVTVTGGAAQRRVLGRGELLVLRNASRRVPRSAFSRIGRPAEAVKRSGCLGTTGAGGAHRAAHGAKPAFDGGARTRRDDAATSACSTASGLYPVFLLRNMQQAVALGPKDMRLSLPAVPLSYLRTTVVQPAPRFPRSLPVGTTGGGGPAMGGTSGPAVAGSAHPAAAVSVSTGNGGGGGPASGRGGALAMIGWRRPVPELVPSTCPPDSGEHRVGVRGGKRGGAGDRELAAKKG